VKTYCYRVVVEDLPAGAAEEVRHSAVLERVVDGTSNVPPDAERSRIPGINTVTTTVPIVLRTCQRTTAYRFI